MPANFIELESVEKLDALIRSSHLRPVVIFKHSMTCGISLGVFREVETINTDIHLVVVQRNRDVSNAISQVTGIRHESPQAIVLVNGSPVYQASHWDIEPSKLVMDGTTADGDMV